MSKNKLDTLQNQATDTIGLLFVIFLIVACIGVFVSVMGMTHAVKSRIISFVLFFDWYGNIAGWGVGAVLVTAFSVSVGWLVSWLYWYNRERWANVTLIDAEASNLQDWVQTITDKKAVACRVGNEIRIIPPLSPDGQALLTDSQIMPHSEWFDHAVSAFHLIVVGETRSGKSTLVGAVAYRRSQRGQVRVIDPHGRAKDWPGLSIVGSGRDYTTINQYFGEVLVEMSRRYELYEGGQDSFEPLTVVVDETTSIADKCDQWAEFFKDLSCEGAKVFMSLIVLIHGKGVKTLNLEGQGDLRNNLRFVYLGKHAINQIAESSQMNRPAILEVDGEDRLIDTSELLNIVPRQTVYDSSHLVLSQSDVEHQTESQTESQTVLGEFEGRELDIAKCILQGLSKTKTRGMVTGDSTMLGRMYDDVKTRLNGSVTTH